MIISSQRCTSFILLSIAFVRHLLLLCVCVCVCVLFSFGALFICRHAANTKKKKVKKKRKENRKKVKQNISS